MPLADLLRETLYVIFLRRFGKRTHSDTAQGVRGVVPSEGLSLREVIAVSELPEVDRWYDLELATRLADGWLYAAIDTDRNSSYK